MSQPTSNHEKDIASKDSLPLTKRRKLSWAESDEPTNPELMAKANKLATQGKPDQGYELVVEHRPDMIVLYGETIMAKLKRLATGEASPKEKTKSAWQPPRQRGYQRQHSRYNRKPTNARRDRPSTGWVKRNE